MNDSLEERCTGSKTLFENGTYAFSLDRVILPDGTTREREHLHHPGGVAILAVNEENMLCLVQQYRHAIGRTTLEIPAGKMDKDASESREHAALRELREETGLLAGRLIPLGDVYPSPGILDERLSLFWAQDLKSGRQELDDDEFLNVRWMPLEAVKKAVAEGTFGDTKTICALYRAMLRGLIAP